MHTLLQFSLEQGVPMETLRFLLLLPIVLTLVSFFRQVVGVKTFGIYTPTLIAFAFLSVGLKYGIALYVAVIAIGWGSRFLLKKWRLLSFSRIAITLTLVSTVLFFLLLLGASTQRTGFAAVSIVPLIIMIVLSEKFISAQAEKNTKIALFLSAQTLLVSGIACGIAQIPALTVFLFYAPWATLLTIPLNIFFGRWTGLRLTEYFRFRSLLK